MLELELSSNDNACLKRRGRIVTSQDSGGSWAAPPSSQALRETRGEGRALGWASPLPRLLCRDRSLVAVIALCCFL